MEKLLVKTHLENHVLHIVLNRADKINAFTYQMLKELSEAYTQLESDKEIRCGFLYSEGEHFTSGLDLADVSKHIQKGATLFESDNTDPLQLFDKNRTKPVIMAVKGYCLTIGIEMILANDVCIAQDNTKFGQIEVKRGIFPFGGATIRFTQRCGWGNAMKYLLTGDEFDAQEALRIGLVQEVTKDAKEDAQLLAEHIARQAPLAVQATLESAKIAIISGEAAATKALMPTLGKLMKTEDAKEGLASFIERRAAEFRGC